MGQVKELQARPDPPAEIRAVLAQLATGTPEQALAAAEKRLKDLAEVSCRCVEATAHFWVYVESEARLPGLDDSGKQSYKTELQGL